MRAGLVATCTPVMTAPAIDASHSLRSMRSLRSTMKSGCPAMATSLLPQRLRRLDGETAERGTDRGKHTHGEHHRDDSGQKYQRPAAHHPTPRHGVECCGDDQSKDDAGAQLCARAAED